MSATRAYLEGWRRVRAAPALLFGVYGVTLLLAVPAALLLRDEVRAHLGSSLAAETAASGVNWDWWQEFSSQASGLSATFTPTIIGFAAVLDNASAVADARWPRRAIATLAGLYLLLWTFLAGGILDRLARHRRLRAAGFFSACGVFFFRFLRLAVFAGAGYWLLFGVVHGWLFNGLYGWATHEHDMERQSFLVRLGLYGLFGLLLAAWNMTLDYAKIRAVVEDRRSMLAAIAAAGRFIAKRPGSVGALYLLNVAVFVLLLIVYGFAAPGAGAAGLSMWLALAIGQAYILARTALKLVFYASETAFFQSQLAHAEYTAAPAPAWPDSPAAEAIANTVAMRP